MFIIKNVKVVIKSFVNNISKVKSSKTIALIRNSLFYNMIVMFLIIMLFLQILFLLSPRKGSISYSGPVINTAEIESESVNIHSTMKSASVNLASKDWVFLEWNQLLLIPTSDDPKIYIKAVNDEFFYTDIFIPQNVYDATKKASRLMPAPHVAVTYNYFDTFVNSKTGFVFDVEDGVTLRLTFSGIDAYTKKETGKIEKVESIEANFLRVQVNPRYVYLSVMGTYLPQYGNMIFHL